MSRSILRTLNRYLSLPDGSVPMLTWLHNAADKTLDLPEAKTFEAGILDLSSKKSTSNRPVSTKTKNGGNERVIHRDDMLDFLFLNKGNQVGSSVAKILVTRYVNGAPVSDDSGNPVIGSGTCWLLTKYLMLTNYHVINERDTDDEFADQPDFDLQARNARAEFDYDSIKSEVTPITFSGCVAADRGMDYALLRASARMNRSPLPLRNQPFSLKTGATVAVNIIQHPNGKPKRIAIRNNIVTAVNGEQLSYFTDTLRGSSGSPVFNDNWQVVALHRGWQPVENVNFQGKETAYANYGTLLLNLLQHIRQQAPGVWEDIRQAHAPNLDSI